MKHIYLFHHHFVFPGITHTSRKQKHRQQTEYQCRVNCKTLTGYLPLYDFCHTSHRSQIQYPQYIAAQNNISQTHKSNVLKNGQVVCRHRPRLQGLGLPAPPDPRCIHNDPGKQCIQKVPAHLPVCDLFHAGPACHAKHPRPAPFIFSP